ncbi:MAG: hypothetical protein NT130_03330 [Candidatus Micrarchaeota archaeon]|nr:hypothetical protein [Candidatus Micrarchaeota archaeon]
MLVNMRYTEHLVLSGIVNGAFLFILYMTFHIDVFRAELIVPLLMTFYIFSILPDIDHQKSHASGILNLFLIYLFGSSAFDFYNTFNPFDLAKIIIAIAIFIVHAKYSENSYLHRKFPHTFTFGIVACLLLYFLANSILVCMVGAISFFTHILSDGYVIRAIEKDRTLWRLVGSKITAIKNKIPKRKGF